MKKLILSSLLIIIFCSAGFAQKSRYAGVPVPISLTNPLSFNGTYKVERLIIRNSDNTLLDSSNSYDVYDDKGIATINMKISQNNVAVDLIYKMQMVGPAFKRAEISNYSFGLENWLALMSGMWDKLKEQFNILKLEKKNDISTIIDKKPFIIIEE